MIYELRIYEVIPGRLPDLNRRFETITTKIWDRLGIKQAGFWTADVGTSNELIYLLAWRGGDSPIRLLLVGIGLGAIASAATTLMITFGDVDDVQRALIWLTGSLHGRSWNELWPLLPWCLVFTPLALLLARDLNALSLGEEIARGLGSPSVWRRGMLLLCAAALAAASVASAGTVGFVGLIAPHIARRLVGPDHSGVLPTAGVLGALIVVVADLAGRTLFAPLELPVGLVTAAVGAPFFIGLLWRQR